MPLCRNNIVSRAFMLCGAVLICAIVHGRPVYGQSHDAARSDLTDLFVAVRDLRQPQIINGIPDYTAAAVDRQNRKLSALRAEFNSLDPSAWPLRDQIDYLIVRSAFDTLDYGLNVYRASSRSPNFYISSISSFGMSSGATLSKLGRLVMQPPPFDKTRTLEIVDHMRNIPRILEQAKRNLTEPTIEMSRWTLPALTDVQGNSRSFAAGLANHVPPDLVQELHAAAREMGGALEDYRQWIAQRLPTMAHARPVGRDLYNWILQRIWLLPFDADDILRFGEQEYSRYVSFTTFEKSRNSGLPIPVRAKTTAEYAANTESEVKNIRQFLQTKNVLTIADFVGPYRRTLMPDYIQAFPLWAGLSSYDMPGNGETKYSVPENHPYTNTYWESIMRVDASTNIFHDGIPGHHFQGIVSARHPSPIRAQHRDRFKSEGWSTYWEETAMQLGYYDDRPRSRELIYSFLRLRALRVIVDVQMALGRMTPDEAIALLMTVPMDRRIASEEVDDFYAAPTGGIVYQVGKMQIERLLAERRGQLGDQFELRQFHDDLVAAAWVPIALTGSEMTGREEVVKQLLDNITPMPRP